MRSQFLALLFISIVLFSSRIAVAAPTVGDTYVYRVTNAYNNDSSAATLRIALIKSIRIK